MQRVNKLLYASFFLPLLFTVVMSRAADAKKLPGDTLQPVKRIYTTNRIVKPPVIDGVLNDSCWQAQNWQSDYTQYSPVYGAKTSKPTSINIVYDDKHIYVAFRVHDDMNLVTRRLGRRDNFDGDLVGVMFDSYFDRRTAFEFDITSAGQKLDVFVQNDGWDMNWDAVWDGKVAYEDSAWTAEMRIPLSQLRYGSNQEQVWGLNSWRLITRTMEEGHWNRIANDGTGQVYTFGELHGLKGLKRSRRIEITPYISTSLTKDQKITGHPYATGSRFNFRPGLDAKIGITNNFTLNATINPDFGQVESDPSVMNLTAFEVYFQEKRPFFTEGKNIFDFSFDEDQLFYSRRIGHAPSFYPGYDTVRMPEFTNIGAALKLSGKTSKGFSLGIIESFTPQTTAEVYHNNQDSKIAVEPLSNYFIGRFQQDFNKGNIILGGILTHTHRSINGSDLRFLSVNALTYGLELKNYWKDRKYFMEMKLIGSTTNGDREAMERLQTSSARYFQRPEVKNSLYDANRTHLNGVGASFQIGKWSKGHWRYNEEFIYRSPGLEMNDLGFMLLSNLIKNNINISYYERKNTKRIKNYAFIYQHQNAWDAGWSSVYNQEKLSLQMEFMNNWTSLFSAQYFYNYTDEWILRGGPAMKVPSVLKGSWQIQSSVAKKFIVAFKGGYHKAASSSLESILFAPEFTLRARSNLQLSLIPSYQRSVDELQYVSNVKRYNNSPGYLLARVNNQNTSLSFRVDLAITPELTIQYYGSPFVSTASFTKYKMVVDPMNTVYEKRFQSLTPSQTRNTLSFDENADAITDFDIQEPDFSYHQFRSNLVVRWEYKVGSSLYLVWVQNRTAMEQGNMNDLGRNYHDVFSIYPRNIFMMKFTYLFRN